jgi:hypothetical protein
MRVIAAKTPQNGRISVTQVWKHQEGTITLLDGNMSKNLFLTTLLFVGIVGCRFAGGGEAPSQPVDTNFSDVVEIVFTNARPDGIAFSISDKTEIEKLTKTISLVPKEPCPCEHSDLACFRKEKSEIWVNFCDHCFVIPSAGQEYVMPKAFYQEFQRLLNNQGTSNTPPQGNSQKLAP